MNVPELISGLPGESLLREGLSDFQSGRRTVSACLVAIAHTRLTRAGIVLAAPPQQQREPELQLYQLLRQQGGDAYSRYNSLLRELISFEQALDRRLRTVK